MQDLNAPANPLETLAYIIAQQISDHSVVYIGTGIPMVAGILAKKTHAPNITLVYESGGQDPIEGDMPWSVGCPMTWRKSPTIMEMSYSFAQCQWEVDIGFWVCPGGYYAMSNTHMIGRISPPEGRLTGSGGNNDSVLAQESGSVGFRPGQVSGEVVHTSLGNLKAGNSTSGSRLIGNGPQLSSALGSL